MFLEKNTDRIPDGKVPTRENGIEIRKTICSICNPNSHCGIDAYVKDGVVIKVEGTKENPRSAGDALFQRRREQAIYLP